MKYEKHDVTRTIEKATHQSFANRHIDHTSISIINLRKTMMHDMVVGQQNMYFGLVHKVWKHWHFPRVLRVPHIGTPQTLTQKCIKHLG